MQVANFDSITPSYIGVLLILHGFFKLTAARTNQNTAW
jgi:hypothetical protein